MTSSVSLTPKTGLTPTDDPEVFIDPASGSYVDVDGEDIGPAELHEMGLCNSAECDWCGEEEDNGR